jgi:hypothetical protein
MYFNYLKTNTSTINQPIMKKQIILSALFILGMTTAYSQETDSVKVTSNEKAPKEQREMQTLLGHNESHGGYGAFSVGYSSIDGRNAVLFGGRFAWIAGHSIAFGFGGTGFINEFHYDLPLDRDVALAGGYGGLYIEPILMPTYPVHLSFPVLFAAGGISYVSKDHYDYNNWIEQTEAFLLVEPGVELEVNITRHFRFAMGATYRFPTGFNDGGSGTPIARAEPIKGFSYMATFKFGRF